MAEVKNRLENPAPNVAFQEIHLPNDEDFGTGSFRFQTKFNALEPPDKPEPKAIAVIALNAPNFQIAVTVNPGTKEIPVLLGRADGSNPLSSKIFLLPDEVNTERKHEFKAGFMNWKILSLTLNGESLASKE